MCAFAAPCIGKPIAGVKPNTKPVRVHQQRERSEVNKIY